MKKTLLFLAFILSTFSFAQTNGITYQAVIYSANGESVPGINNANAPLANRKICLQFNIVDDFSQTEYQEKVTVTTDDYGMVNLIIGTGIQTGGYANSFESIVWNSAKKYLKVSLDQSGNCNSFDEISNQVLSYVPFALAANSATSVSGIVGIANGGTNASTILGAKTNLQLQNVDNTSDLNKPLSTATQTVLNAKVDKETGKDLSSNDYTNAEKIKLAAILGVNTGDQDLSPYATNVALATKVDKVTGKELSSNDYTTVEKNKLGAITGTNTGDQDLSPYATNIALETKVDKVTGKELSSNDYTTLEKTKLAAITGTNTGDQDLSLFASTVSVALKANTADVTSDLATKVDKVTGKELSSNDYTTVEKNKLAAITGTNTGDQDLSPYATNIALETKVDKVTGKELSSNDYTTVEKTKLAAITGTNTGDQDLSLFASTASVALKANTADVTSDLATKVDKVTGKELSSNDYTTVEKNKLAAITGTNTGDQDLSTLATTASLAFKADIVSPSFSGVPTAPTASLSSNTNQVATTAFVTNATTGKFVDLITNQTIAGTKTFNSDLIANGLIIGKGKGQNNYNTVFGAGALNSSNANGTRNTAIGYLALTQYAGNTFDNNTGVGYFNMIGLTTGYGNTSIGAETMFNVGTASNNTGIGNQSLINAAGDNNVGVGARSGDGLTTGTNNTFIGTQARTTSAGATITNATALGYGAVVTENNTIQLGNSGVTNIKTSGKLTTGAITLPNTDGTTGQILTTNGTGLVAWSTPTNISISTINENSNSNGATIANGVIKLSPADAINGGIVTTGNQTFSGNKIVVGNLETQTSLDTPVKDINANNPTSPVGAPDQEARQSFTAGISGYLSNIKVKLFSSGTYTISIYKGGNIMSENNPGGIQLFQTTFTSINNVMSSIPITNTPITAGDIYWIKISGTSLNIGLNWGQSNVGTTVSFPAYRGGISQSWIFETYVSQLIGGNITVAGSIISSGFKTPSGTSSQYLMADGSVTNVSSGSTSASVDLITNQTIAGTKTFNSDIKVNGLIIGKGIGQVNDQNITIGENTLTNNTTGQHLIALGGSTLQSNTSANYNIGIGSSALSGNSTGENNIAIGAAALAFNNGSNNTAVGLSASLLGSANSNVTSLGYQAGMLNTGSSNTFIGASTDQTTASTSITNSTAIGYGAKISAANQIQLGNTSVINVKTSGSYTGSGFKTPTGTSSQYLMADGSVSSGSSGSTIASVDLTTNQTIAGSKTFSSDLNVSGLTIGGTSNTTILGANASGGPFSTTIGNNASSPSSYSVAIGRYSNAMSSYSMAIGGLAAKASESYSLAIGGNAPEATGVYSTAIGGSLPKATALQSTALGSSTTASGQNSTALGYGATVSSDNTIQLGNTSVTDVKTSGSLTAKSIISFGKMVMSTATIEYSQLNNYDVSNVSILFVKPNSTWTNIYGLSGGTIGQIIHIYSVNNQTSNCCTALSLWNYDSSSNTGIQKFVAPGGINIGSNEDTTLVFDGTYWRVSNFGM